MKTLIKQTISVIVCLIMLVGLLQTGAVGKTEGTITTYSLPLYFSSATVIEAGDINGDGKVNNKDLTRLFQYLSDWDVEVKQEVLDVNGDNKVNNKDLTRLFQYLSDWDVEIFPKPIECSHDGETELRGVKEPSCSEEGYTGDTYCLTCDRIILFGETISKLPHTGGNATCCQKAICEVCHSEYGELDPTIHYGGSQIRGAYPVTCSEQGYTGDTYCLGCGELLYEGTYIEPTGHVGGVSTYYQKPICDICGEEYGEYSRISAYDSLNDNQKGFYRRLQNMVFFLEMSEVDVTEYCGDFTTYEDDINIAFRALSYDRPDIFWIPRNIYIPYSYNARTGEIISVYLTFNSDESYDVCDVYGIDDETRDEMLNELNEKVNEIVALTADLDTDFDKEVIIHDYICQFVSYDYDTAGIADPTGGSTYAEYDPLSFTAYGALIKGKAVCEGYSRAMQLICQKIGIPCGLVSGIGNGGPHMWNIINPGDGCYYLDVTFDDPTGYTGPCLHTYFNQTKANMEADHTFDDVFVQGERYWYVDDDGFLVELEYNFFETHGDNTALEYYSATGAYINSNDAKSAAEYTLSMYNKGNSQVAIKFDTGFGAANAKSALANALKGKLKLAPGYSTVNNILIVTIHN